VEGGLESKQVNNYTIGMFECARIVSRIFLACMVLLLWKPCDQAVGFHLRRVDPASSSSSASALGAELHDVIANDANDANDVDHNMVSEYEARKGTDMRYDNAMCFPPEHNVTTAYLSMLMEKQVLLGVLLSSSVPEHVKMAYIKKNDHIFPGSLRSDLSAGGLLSDWRDDIE